MENTIYSLLKTNNKLSHTKLGDLLKEEGKYNENEVVKGINELLGKGQISISEENGEVVYFYQSEKQASAFMSLSPEEVLVLQLLRDSGSRGMWNLEIKSRTGIPTQQINKILRNLEKQGHVQGVKSVQHKNRKIWLLAGETPSSEITGGFLFSEEQFDKGLLSELLKNTTRFLEEYPANIREITLFLRQKVTKSLTEENVQEVVKSLVALGELQEGSKNKYFISKWEVPDPLVTPCIACPLQRQCAEGALINPGECEYLTNWLDF